MNYCLNPYCKNPNNPDNTTVCLSCNSNIILDNRYRPIKFIGGGGQGRNFLAIDEKTPTKKRCVIKQFCPHPNIANDPRNLQKANELFNREATVLDELGDESPQIPRLLAHLEQDKRLYLVQEFIDGENLLDELAQNGNFSEAKINDFLNEFLPILKFIHKRGVIHRDIKPENIMRRKDGLLFLIDFGLSKQMSGTIMVMGTVGGTMGYAPSEQLIYGEAYFASDIYALGAACIHLLTGIPPHQLFNPREKRWLWEDILSQRGEGVSKYLSQILNKMLMLDVQDRYENVDEILQVLKVETYPVVRSVKPQQQNFFQKIFNISPVNCIQSIEDNNFNQNYRIYKHGDLDFAIRNLEFHPDGQTLATSYYSSKDIKLWDWKKGDLITNLTHEKDDNFTFSFQPKTNLIVILGNKWNAEIKILKTDTNKELKKLKIGFYIDDGVISPLAISPNGQFVVTVTYITCPIPYFDFSGINVLDLESEKVIYNLSSHYLLPSCLSFTPDSKILATSGDDGLINLWDLKTGNLIRTIKDSLWNLKSLQDYYKSDHYYKGINCSIKSLSFNPQGDILASAGWDTNIKLWNPNNGQLIRTLTGHKDVVNSIAFSPDGQILASGSNDMTIKVWEVKTGKEICTLKGHAGFINCVAFSPDGQVLASGSNDKTIKIWRWD